MHLLSLGTSSSTCCRRKHGVQQLAPGGCAGAGGIDDRRGGRRARTDETSKVGEALGCYFFILELVA